MLDLQYLVAGSADGQIVTRPGGWHTGNGYGGVDIHIAAIIVVDNVDGRVAAFSQVFGTPLAQPFAGGALSVTVGGKDRLPHTGTRQIICKDGVYQPVNVGIDITSVNPFLVVSGRGGNCKIIALVPIPRNRQEFGRKKKSCFGKRSMVQLIKTDSFGNKEVL